MDNSELQDPWGFNNRVIGDRLIKAGSYNLNDWTIHSATQSVN